MIKSNTLRHHLLPADSGPISQMTFSQALRLWMFLVLDGSSGGLSQYDTEKLKELEKVLDDYVAGGERATAFAVKMSGGVVKDNRPPTGPWRGQQPLNFDPPAERLEADVLKIVQKHARPGGQLRPYIKGDHS